MPLRNPVVIQSIATLRAWIKARLLAGERQHCPVCDRYTAMYNRKVTSSMAFALIKVRRHLEDNPQIAWLHVSSYLATLPIPPEMLGPIAHCDFPKMRWWGLIEEKPRLSKEPHSGYWRVTDKGRDFVDGCIDITHHAHVINNVVVGWGTDRTDIYEAIKDKFDYRELIS